MKVEIKNLPKSELEIEVELTEEEFNKFWQKGLEEIGKEIEMEGFRKGKVPKEILEKKIEKERILNQASQLAIKESYFQIVKDYNLEPISQPKVEILKLAKNNPFQFKVRVEVLPELKLPDYKKIASQCQKREIKVLPEEIERLKAEKEKMEKERLRGEILEKISQKTEGEIPEILIEKEKERMLEQFKKELPRILGINFEEYLKRNGKTEKEILDSFESEAKRKVKNFLILREIEKKEKIEASQKEIEEELEKFLALYPQNRNLAKEELKEYIKSVINQEKVLQFLENLAKI